MLRIFLKHKVLFCRLINAEEFWKVHRISMSDFTAKSEKAEDKILTASTSEVPGPTTSTLSSSVCEEVNKFEQLTCSQPDDNDNKAIAAGLDVLEYDFEFEDEKEKLPGGNIDKCDGSKNKKDEEDMKVWQSIKQQNLGKVPYPNLKISRSRFLTDATAVFHHNAWDDVEWDEEMEATAIKAVEKNSLILVEPEQKLLYEDNANQFWDKFYGIHQNKFFRDRNWLFSEFPELESQFGCSVKEEDAHVGVEEKRLNESYDGENSGFKVLEIGCGAGNTVFPLLSANNNPETYVYCCDFSSSAVEIVKTHPKFEPGRCTAFVLDATSESPTTPFPMGSIDVITLIFVTSAISPEKFNQTITNLFNFLKPGGIILFRDYGRYDMAQLRFREGRCLSDNFYVRGDGTRVYFFTLEEVENMFVRNGFVKEKLVLDKRLQVNRGRQLKMYRVWIQGKFKKTNV